MNVKFLITFLLFSIYSAFSQSEASIVEEIISIDTYGFHTPNPVPIVADNPKIPPYFKYEGYSHNAVKKDWNVVTLENDYIKLWVLPEIGGKVWGAIEKSTGEEFLYKNEVIKFRNIAMRGPWTSGGIEFNFGIIGHHPSTATPVDYETRTNKDGSVSCIVGNIDLPSNTKWTVEIRLEKDKAYFETNASWYNASPLTESYYNWMTAAAVATNDLEFFIPGNAYLEHNGNAHPWPIDKQGRNLAMYKNNTFGPAKSYHIVGEYNDFFGGYYHNKNFGYGQWSPYEEMPGQKLWLWALSRSGGIWEDLLTDSDGQYIEFQAGRLFDQYFPGAVNPISQVGFDPYVMDRWSEIWFPYKEIGGMEDASEHGVLNLEYKDGEIEIGVNALQNLTHELQVTINEKVTFSDQLDLKPMEVFSAKLPAKKTDKIKVSILGTDLEYTNDPKSKQIKRPFYPDKNLEVSKSEELYQSGIEALEYREYKLSHELFSELVKLDPSHRSGLLGLAELEYRRTDYKKALELTNRVLMMDTYNSKANYLAGITYRVLNDPLNALESLGWAARDIKYRSVAYAQMAEIYLGQKNYDRAQGYAQKSLNFNSENLNAKKVLLITERELGLKSFWNKKEDLSHSYPFDYVSSFESYFWNGTEYPIDISKLIRNEFPDETLLGVAIEYYHLQRYDNAIQVILKGGASTKNKIWLAYLSRNKDIGRSQSLVREVIMEDVKMVFPYRRETIPVLEWATEQNPSWKLKYYLAQNYITVGLEEKGLKIITELENEPNSDIFYRFRARLNKGRDYNKELSDYQKAYALNQSDWKLHEEFIQFYLANNKFQEALKLSTKAYRNFATNYNIGLAHAKALLYNGKYENVLNVLKKIRVLPFEHASESRDIYERAHTAVALSHIKKNKNEKALEVLKKCKEWPENIGVGKPYDPEERLQDYMMAVTLEKMNETEQSTTILMKIVDKTQNEVNNNSLDHLFGLLASKKLDNGSLNKLVQSLELSENQKTQTALAIFNGDKAKIESLKADGQLPKDIIDIMRWSVEN